MKREKWISAYIRYKGYRIHEGISYLFVLNCIKLTKMSDIESNPVAGQNDQASNAVIQLVFIKETALFGDIQTWMDKPYRACTAISKRIDSSHITGLQRVRGLWNIYIDNLQDNVSLMGQGVPFRGKIIPVVNTNPQSLDGKTLWG